MGGAMGCAWTPHLQADPATASVSVVNRSLPARSGVQTDSTAFLETLTASRLIDGFEQQLSASDSGLLLLQQPLPSLADWTAQQAQPVSDV
ncbi:hypothetical protein [Rubripirellula lacrimiformis]|uniref:hypothetical protein n=1 Tax=Rubripirellula lacrimiformis TaxID=1930273 RepID=UPI001C54F8FE|nr:hypothetical protein [Rubripirellula lacrimiformis]